LATVIDRGQLAPEVRLRFKAGHRDPMT
jgi:hypothetical protein